MKIKKPTRKTVKTTAIVVGVIGGSLALNKGWTTAVHAYYEPRIGLAMHQHLIAEIDKINPEVLRQAVETCELQLLEALTPIITA